MTETPRKHISVIEASQLCGLHRKTIRRYVDSGALEGFRLPTGGRRVYRDSALDLIASKGTGRAKPPRRGSNPESMDVDEPSTTVGVLLDPGVYEKLAERARSIGGPK